MTPETERLLRAAGEAADDAVDMGETALALAAADLPGLVLDPYRDHLARLGRDVAERARDLAERNLVGPGLAGTAGVDDAMVQARALAEVLAGEFGYDGDRATYDDMSNANLVRVIDRRCGLPVALGILYIHAGRMNGWRLSGVNFPGHFLVRMNGEIAGGPPPVFVDPFSGGRVMDEDALRALFARVSGAAQDADGPGEPSFEAACRPVPARTVLLRLQNNIYSRAVNARDMGRAGAVLERMLLIAPREASLWLERGRMAAQAGNLLAAREAYLRAGELALSDGRSHLVREARLEADRLRRSLN